MGNSPPTTQQQEERAEGSVTFLHTRIRPPEPRSVATRPNILLGILSTAVDQIVRVNEGLAEAERNDDSLKLFQIIEAEASGQGAQSIAVCIIVAKPEDERGFLSLLEGIPTDR